MKNVILLLALLFFAGSAFAQASQERISFNEGWSFQRGDAPDAGDKLSYKNTKQNLISGNADRTLGFDVAYTQPAFDDSKWRKLNLPHDWGIEGNFQQELPGETGKLPWAGVGWYRKHFALSRQDAGKKIYIDFDGAMAYPLVWLNGKFVGGWAYGYSSFRLDLTPFVEYGRENVIAVRLENPSDSSRWYPGSGIYRNVWLVKTAPIHVGHWGTYITTSNISSQSAEITIRTTVDNDQLSEANIVLRTFVFDRSQKPVAIQESPAKKIPASGSQTIEQKLIIKNPLLWSIESPNLYSARIQVIQNGNVIDTYDTTFGIRTIRFDAEKGFLLNGEHVYIKGVCMHHDLGALGTALNTRALERQLEILKEMGVNAIRTSHNPPAPELLDLADRIGFVVMDEGFDAWTRAKKPNDYHLLFADWHEKDWRSQIRRDRNHPSIILWSIGNEVEEQRDESGHKIAAELARIAHEEDPTRPVTAGANYANAGYNGFENTVDVFGYNYRWNLAAARYPSTI